MSLKLGERQPKTLTKPEKEAKLKMSTKTGAGGKPQKYDEHTGRYGDGNDADLLAEREFKQEQLARKAEGRMPLKRDIYMRRCRSRSGQSTIRNLVK